jgi:ribonuclease T1
VQRKIPGIWLTFFLALSLTFSVFARESTPGLRVAQYQALPAEAKAALALIRRGGPYPFSKDGAVFGNYEKSLPRQPRGYYHEFTVKTPGAHNRGARRIITGGNPPQPLEFYYTEDHYATFWRIQE